MCGGRGTRLACGPDDERTEKPLVEVRGVPMVERVLTVLRASHVETTFLVTSPHAPDTRAHLASLLDAGDLAANVEIVDAPGDGYVSDLGYALDRVSSPTLTVACDLPLLAPVVVNRVLDRAEGCRKSLAVYVPAALKRRLGTSTDSTWEHGGRALAPTGLNVVAREQEETTTTTDTDRDGAPSMHTTSTHTEPTDAEPTDTASTAADRHTDTDTDTDVVYVSYDARLAVNVNRPADLAVAEALCE